MDLLIENVLIIGSDEFYRATRYRVPLFVILINTNDRDAFNILEKYTRQTDIVQQLNSDLLVLLLAHTDYDEALFFMNKIKDKFNFTYTSKEFINSELLFIETLFRENAKKIEGDFNQYWIYFYVKTWPTNLLMLSIISEPFLKLIPQAS